MDDRVVGCDLYNGTVTYDKACSLNANTGASANHAVPSVMIEKVGAFMGEQGAKARSIAWRDDGTAPTLKTSLSGGNAIPEVVYVKEAEHG